jgi:hypothetical protein
MEQYYLYFQTTRESPFKRSDCLDKTYNLIKESSLIRLGYQLNFVATTEVLTFCNAGKLSAFLEC